MSREDLNGRVMGLLIRLSNQLDPLTLELVHELIDHNERGVALETIADTLGSLQGAVATEERMEILELAAAMGMTNGFVERALGKCQQPG